MSSIDDTDTDPEDYRIDFDTYTREFKNDNRLHSDADSIRRRFGIPAYSRERFQYANVFANMLEHVWDGEPRGATKDKGGTDVLGTGDMGSGKSTLLLYIAVRLMEINNEKVVWRASTSRSEWLPFSPWARICVPEGVEMDARLVPKDPTDDVIDDVEIDDFGREVVEYTDVVDLLENKLKPGMFHVVYPDPHMRKAQTLYDGIDELQHEELEFSPDDPTSHWWFAFIMARIYNGPHDWTTLLLDEMGDLAPQSAQKDEFSTYQKVEMLKDCYVDSRRNGFSMFAFGHNEVDIHEKVRRKVRWRIHMPGSANPTTKSDLIGFNNVPMNTDQMSHRYPGTILSYTQQNYELLQYSHVPSPINHNLEVSLK